MVRAFLRLQSLCVLLLLSGLGVVPGYSEEPVVSSTSTTLKSGDPDAALAAFKSRKEVVRNNADQMIDDLAFTHSSLMFWLEQDEYECPSANTYFQGEEAYWKLVQAIERARILSRQMEEILDKASAGKMDDYGFERYCYYRAESEDIPEKKIEWLRKGLASLKKGDIMSGFVLKLQLSTLLIKKGEIPEATRLLSEAIAGMIVDWLPQREEAAKSSEENMPEQFMDYIKMYPTDFADAFIVAQKSGVDEEAVWQSVTALVEKEKGKNDNSRKAIEEARNAFAKLKKKGLLFLERISISAFSANTYLGVHPKTVDYLRMLSGGVEHVEPRPYVEKVQEDTSVLIGDPVTGKILSVTPGTKELASIEMVWIPGGKFQMGSEASESGRNDNEGPVREVEVRGFWMSKYEITQEQYSAVLGERENRSKFKAPKNPVENVTNENAGIFCNRLSLKVKRGYDLPDEEQWEYACRAGVASAYSVGTTLSQEVANFNGSSPKLVGSYAPNAFGLCDMYGNVAEWTKTRFNFYPGHRDRINFGTLSFASARSDSNHPTWFNTVRGGSWGSAPAECRSAFRDRVFFGKRSDRIGFRIVRNY